MKPPVVGFAGMTHLGWSRRPAVAARGFEVVCFDADRALIDRLARGDWPVLEPGLDELIRRQRRAPALHRDARVTSQPAMSSMWRPTCRPTTRAPATSRALSALIAEVAAAMKPAAVMVVLSQVPPGYTRALGVLPPARLYYQVETLVFGQAVRARDETRTHHRRLRRPGGAARCAFSRRARRPSAVPILPMRYESAELAKISINCCLVASVTVGNTLAELCERIGADWSEIAPP